MRTAICFFALLALVGCAHFGGKITEEEANFPAGGIEPTQPEWDSETQQLTWYNVPDDGWVVKVRRTESGDANFTIQVGQDRYEQIQEMFAMQCVVGRMMKADYPAKGWCFAFTDTNTDMRFDKTELVKIPSDFAQIAAKELEDHTTL